MNKRQVIKKSDINLSGNFFASFASSKNFADNSENTLKRTHVAAFCN